MCEARNAAQKIYCILTSRSLSTSIRCAAEYTMRMTTVTVPQPQLSITGCFALCPPTQQPIPLPSRRSMTFCTSALSTSLLGSHNSTPLNRYTNEYCGLAASGSSISVFSAHPYIEPMHGLLVLFIYDAVVTFDQEVAYFWGAGWSGASLLFFANKGISLILYALVLVELASFPSDEVRDHPLQSCHAETLTVPRGTTAASRSWQRYDHCSCSQLFFVPEGVPRSARTANISLGW